MLRSLESQRMGHPTSFQRVTKGWGTRLAPTVVLGHTATQNLTTKVMALTAEAPQALEVIAA